MELNHLPLVYNCLKMKLLKGQHWHLLLLIILLGLLYFYTEESSGFFDGNLWGLSSPFWFWLALAVPIVHQVYVLLGWRLELMHNTLTQKFGSRAFPLFKSGFALLIFLRPVSIILLAVSNAGTLDVPMFLALLLSCLLLIPSVYLFYSVKKYFGINRAFGEDHFRPDEYKGRTMITKGIFKYTRNGMYLYGFLILYVPGLLLLSKAAVAIACFNHFYIWVHYYFTEKPDMKFIYH